MPEELEKKMSSVKEPGDTKLLHGVMNLDKHIMAASWQDVGKCSMLSTAHTGEKTSVLRHVRGQAESVDRPTLDCFSDYNYFMGGVDLADQKLAMLTCRLRAYKWWHAIFFLILDSLCD
jgi:hypothetical protein